jgi:hypothetical protein
MKSPWLWIVLVVSLAVTGCSTDREQQLIGSWKGDATSATFAAIKLKEDSGASVQDATNAAKMMAATSVKLNKDKTFTSKMAGATLTGQWTFNKETGEVVLTGSKLLGPDQKEVPAAGVPVWTAYLSKDNDKLSFYPADPAGVATIRQMNVKGGLTQGISLYKK